MKTVPLADILRLAANLLDHRAGFSCVAVDVACGDFCVASGPFCEVDRFLRDLGCETGTVMSWFKVGPERQGVRFLWLLLAMHAAADEGLTVEVL